MNVREGAASLTGTTAAKADLAARYRSLFEIGRGGMGTIEVALERTGSGFERIVALKRMHPESARERRETEMFLREARLAAWLVHPNVVHAFAFGEIDGELFLAMEYVEGETLSAMVRAARERSSGALPPALVASVLADACEGLHASHELRDPQTGTPLNVIHRDVSPHNVMVSYEGHVKLLDFGVAKMDSRDPLTRTGEVKGKTGYMSPEQAMGETLDRRSDLFSVGAVLFECVSGQRMWGGGTDLEVLRRLALEDPPSLAGAAPLAPRALVDLHARLVARDVSRRPKTALAVAEELRGFVARSGVRADARAIAETMTALFANGAADRKRRLNEALDREVPAARAEVLRRSLAGPTALAALTPRVAASPPITPRSGARSESMAPRATKRGVAASALVGLAIAAGIVAVTSATSMQRGGGGASPTTTPAVSPVLGTSTIPTATTPVPLAETASAASLAPSGSVAPAPTSSAERPPRNPGAPPPPHRAVRPPVRPASSGRAVDVDTNPL
jgi:hypothetical protein